MSNVWAQLIADVEPELEKLADAMRNGPTYSVTLRPIADGWIITIEEEWEYSRGVLDYSSFKLGERCDWAEKELAKWPDASRQSWTSWKFKSKHDAEKFITLYGLVWGE